MSAGTIVHRKSDLKNRGMARLDLAEIKALEKRETHLSILAAVFVMVQAAGVVLLMYPMVFLHPDEGNKWTMRSAFVGFIVLTLLFVMYLFDRQRTVGKLKQHLMEEMERNTELRNQASADLLHGLADLNHFHDQLAMEFRRAMNMEKPLSLIVVKVNVAPNLGGEKEITSALGEAVKAMAKSLRPTDVIYSLAPDLFGVMMTDTTSANAKLIELRLEQTLRSVGSPNRFGFEITTCNYPDQVQSAHELEDIVSSLMPEKTVWEEVGTSR